jgi:hypothetical protein
MEGASFPIAKCIRGRRELKIKISIPNPTASAHLVHFLSTKLRIASKSLHCLDADQGAREWEGAKPESFQSEYLKFLGEQRMKLRASYRFQIDPDRNQIR